MTLAAALKWALQALSPEPQADPRFADLFQFADSLENVLVSSETRGHIIDAVINLNTMSREPPKLRYVQYDQSKEAQYLGAIRQLISKDLSEPYSIYVYRYFLYQWSDLCFMALDETDESLRGVVVSKLEVHRGGPLRGYIAMLATQEEFRNRGIATQLVRMAIEAMASRGAHEIALETEVTNEASLKLYERLGFIRSKRLHRYYLNGNGAFRLILYLKKGTSKIKTYAPDYPVPEDQDYASPAASTAQSRDGGMA